MNKSAIVFNAVSEGYSIDQLRKPMTVGELKELLEDYEDDSLVILSFDNGYTYGSLNGCMYYEKTEEGWEEY